MFSIYLLIYRVIWEINLLAMTPYKVLYCSKINFSKGLIVQRTQ